MSTVCSLHFNYQGWEVQTNDTELSANDIGRLGVQSNIKSMLLLMLLQLPTSGVSHNFGNVIGTECSFLLNYQGWEVQTNDTELSANDIERLGVQSNIKSILLLMLLQLPTSGVSHNFGNVIVQNSQQMILKDLEYNQT